jgi:hypothetical protein
MLCDKGRVRERTQERPNSAARNYATMVSSHPSEERVGGSVTAPDPA